MVIQFLKYSALSMVLMFGLASCQEDSNLPGVAEPTNTTTKSTLAKVRSANGVASANNEGEKDLECFSFKYPLTIIMSDGTKKTVNNDDEMDAACQVDDNLESSSKLQYPVTLLVDGKEVVAKSDADMDAVLRECIGAHDDAQVEEEGEAETCFELKYPVSLQIPGGTTVTVNSYDEEVQKTMEYYDANSESDAVIDYVFPITVVGKDKKESVISSNEQLEKVYEDCYGKIDFGQE